jgi:DNA-binding CsgD family transcriptional regulator
VDLEAFATAAYLVCRDDDAWRVLDRAYQTYRSDGDRVGAARCAFWLGIGLIDAGELAQAAGWFGRARRLLDRVERDCVERGYLLVPDVLLHLGSGDVEAARATAERVAEIGERFAEPDLVAFALVNQGRALVKQGLVAQGLALLDEGMLGVVAGELSSPLFTGMLYCSVIDGCNEVFDLRRAREWTAALTRWCERHPDMVNFTGLCLVHRAEVLLWNGAWREALAEAQQATERLVRDPLGAGAAHYRQGEVHRLLGEFAAAEHAYRAASQHGWEPQPGLALLRLAQGRPEAAAAAIGRALEATVDHVERARLLPACVEITLAADDTARAHDASRELSSIAESRGNGGVLDGLAAHAQGAVALAVGDASAALIALRRACRVWQQLDAPYELARSRMLAGLGCRALGDDDSATLEIEAARDAFTRLGAAPDLAHLEAHTGRHVVARTHGLTPREHEVLRLVAAGRSNKAIAAELVLSGRTVERHVSNILTKLGVASRAAAGAYAHRHQLV